MITSISAAAHRQWRRLWNVPPLKYAAPQRFFLVSWKPVLFFAAVFVLPDLLIASAGWARPAQLRKVPPEMRADIASAQAGLLCVASLLYGLTRPSRYHPHRTAEYAKWLERTPWTWRRPLPLGPVHLGWRDGLVIGGLAAGALYAGFHPAVPAALLLWAYLLVVAMILGGSGAPREATALAFGLPAVTFLWDRPWWALLATAAVYAVGYAGLRRSLRAFPWHDPEEEKIHPSLRPPESLPWPMDVVGPLPPDKPISWAKGLVVPALWGWWLYAAVSQPAAAEWVRTKLGHLSPLAVATAVGVVAAGCRLLNFAAGRSAPIGLRGRLLHGPLLVPRYDQIFFAPLCTLVLAIVAPLALHRLGVDDIAGTCAAITLCLAAAINLPPNKYAWKLTGAHQVSRAAGKDVGADGEMTMGIR